MTTLQIIGGGKMGEALLGGLVAHGWAAPHELAVVELDESRRRDLTASHPGVDVRSEPLEAVDALVAVKPGLVVEVCAALRVERIVSIAAGVRIAAIEAAAPTSAVIRVMPNTPALVGRGAAGVAAGTRADDADVQWARSVLESVGAAVVVTEDELDAVTGLSGSGPAYVFAFAEALVAAGVAEGLDPDVAVTLTEQTLLGAATLLVESDRGASQLREDVTSPNGTTAAGLAALEAGGFGPLVARVVAAASERSRELGRA